MISPSLLRYHMEGLSKFITILHGGVFPIYYNITMGGVSRDPKFVLRNIWTAPNMCGAASKRELTILYLKEIQPKIILVYQRL